MDEMCSTHFGIGKNGPWTESVVVVKPGATDEQIQEAADTAKKLAAQFSEEVEQAKQDSESLAARFVLERMELKEIHERMDEGFAGSCRMPIGKFGDAQFPGKTVAEVYEECPKAVHWVGFDMAVEMLKDAGADKRIGIVACGVYWNLMERVKTGLSAQQSEQDRVGKDPAELVGGKIRQQQADEYQAEKGQVDQEPEDLDNEGPPPVLGPGDYDWV